MNEYFPGCNLAFDEITILMTGATFLKHITRHKPVHESIMFWALAESIFGRQYLWWFDIDRNDGKPGKIAKAVMQSVTSLPERVGHRIEW